MNYLTASLLCIVSLLIALSLVKDNELLNDIQKRKFSILAILIAFEIFVDAIVINIGGLSNDYSTTLKFVKIGEFIVAPYVPMILAYLISRRTIWKRVKKYFYIVVTINTVLQIITVWYPLMFTIDENYQYSRTHYTYVYLALLLINFGLLILCSVKTFIQNFRKFNSLTLITIFLLLGVIMRIINPNSNSDWMGVTFGYYMFFVYFTNSFCKIDKVTSLLNQISFINRKSQINYSTVFIVLDVNDFKRINDTKGHEKGDECLRIIGESIYTVYGHVGFCYRSGGDEFTVILKPGILDIIRKNNNGNIYGAINWMMKRLDREIERQSKKEPLLKSGVSQGFGIYKVIEEYHDKKDYKTVDEVIEIADNRMYKAKWLGRNKKKK